MRNEWWSFVVKHFQSVWWNNVKEGRKRSGMEKWIYFIEEILWTLKLQKSTTMWDMMKKWNGKKNTHTEEKRKKFNKFALFVSVFFSLAPISLCFSFRFYSSTKFMSINWIWYSFGADFFPYTSTLLDRIFLL